MPKLFNVYLNEVFLMVVEADIPSNFVACRVAERLSGFPMWKLRAEAV